MAGLPDLANLDYVARVNRAIDHVTAHLAEPLPLEEVARAACFSPYHFHRIFKALTGETLLAFVKRLRLERAVLEMSRRPDAALTEVALACGFSSSSDFSRSFRAHYGMPPSVFDVDAHRATGRARLERTVTASLPRLAPGANPDGFAVALRDLPARRVAYIRVSSPYEGDGVARAAERLRAWAEPRALVGGQWLGYQWDDPEVVALEKCRYDVGLEIPEGVVGGGEIGVTTFEPVTVAEVDIRGPIELEMRAIDWVYDGWLPRSGYVPAHQPAFEAWNGLPFEHGTDHFELRMQLPVARRGRTT